ncbi:MAG TPA: type VI secretion protein IcmF/TssM N-terminal domain-containing protein [Kofleriaceae bacterium]|nr:type VI secretion protein IcmF/TssM N-terminal domain-containing protein [Kofleriaceae bacterium]
MGDAGAGKSHLINTQVDWRGQANQFHPSSVDSPHLQLYLGSSVVVHELSAPLLRDTRRATRRALVRMWRRLGPSATVVVVVDARTLPTTPPDHLRELAELVRGKIGALPAHCRAALSVRVCLSHLDQIEGYTEIAPVIGAQHGPLDVRALGERLTDPRAVTAAARALVASLDGHLAHALTHQSSDSFARLVRFYAAFPAVLGQLAPLLRTLTGESPDHPHFPPAGLYLSALAADHHVGEPFTIDHDLVAFSIAQQRRFYRRASLAIATAGLALVSALMGRHYSEVTAAQAAVAHYDAQVTLGRGPGEPEAIEVAHVLASMYSGERLWLSHTFVTRKRQLEDTFADYLRKQYILPKLENLTTKSIADRATILYVVALLYAAEDNGLEDLIRDHLPFWVAKTQLSLSLVSTYLDLKQDQYAGSVEFAPSYAGADWQGYVFDHIKPLYEQAAPLTQAQLDDVARTEPVLFDAREYEIRRHIVELMSARFELANQPSIKALLDSPLSVSSWVESNIDALHGITTAVARTQLAVPSPRTLGELGAALERLLAAPATGREVYHVSRTQNGQTESFAFDAAVWNHKLAQSSAALMIANAHATLAHPDATLGFFPAAVTTSATGTEGTTQGPSLSLPPIYTAAAFAQQVAPALDFITTRAASLDLPADTQALLADLFRTQIEDYAGRYVGALRAYYISFRFEPGSEDALPFTLTAMMQPSSWFLRFLTTVAVNAAPTLGDGPYYQFMSDALQDFHALGELLAPAKGTIPGIAFYQQLITQLATSLEPAAPSAPSADAGAPGLASILAPSGMLMLNKLTGADKDKIAQIHGWLAGANIPGNQAAPFLAPVQAAYGFGLHDLDAAVAQAWSHEMSPVISPLLIRFPFRPGAPDDVAVADLEGVVRAQGKQPGAFWVSFARWLAPVMVQHNGKYQWLGEVTGPAGTLDEINGLARLSRALWDADGNPAALPIDITPQPLDASPVAGRIPTLAAILSGSAAVYAFNQRPHPSTLALAWWDQAASSVMVRLSRPGSSDTVTYSVDESGSAFSFYRLLCRAHSPNRAIAKSCAAVRGPLVWDVALGGSVTRPISFTLDTDPWALFHIR